MATASAESDSASVIDDARFGGFQLSIAALCALVAALDGFDTQAIAYVAPSIAEAWHVKTAAFGSVFSIGLLGLTIGAFVLSPAADRFGRRTVILLSTAIFGLLALATSTAQTMDQLLLFRLLTGIGLGGAMPNLIALTNEYAPSRLKATLVMVMFCGFPLGSTIGGLVTAPLIAAHGWRSVFVAGGVAPLVLLLLLMWKLPESIGFLALRPGKAGKVAALLRKVDPHASADAFIAQARERAAMAGKRPALPFVELFTDGRAARTSLLWVAFFMNLLVMYFLVNWLPSLLKANGLPLGMAILSTAVLNLGGVAGAILLGRLIDRANPFLILGSAYAASAVFIAVIAYAGANVPLLLIGAALAGFGVVGAQIGLNAIAASLYPIRARATGVGWALGVGRIGSILGPVAGGVLLAAGWSTQSLLLTAVGPAVIASAAVFALGRVR
jgi:AAHS family 4-hydroxybenzoate transporter-like MFS transporter